MSLNQILDNWLEPLLYLFGGIFIGIVIELILFNRFRKVTTKVKWKGFEVLTKSLRFMPMLWFFLLGFYSAVIHIDPEVLYLDLEFINLLSDGIFIVIIISIMLVFSRIVNGFIMLYTSDIDGNLKTTSIATNVTNFFFIMIGLLIIIQSLGIEITPLLTLLGVGGLTVALALQPTLTNFFAGMYFIVSREFSVGDYIKLDSGEEGYIMDMNWRHIIIRPPSKYNIVIPNMKLSTSSVVNYKVSDKETAIIIATGVGYDSDLDHVESITIEVAHKVIKQVQGESPIKNPYIRYHTFAPYSVDFNVILYTKNLKDRARIKHEFIKQLYKKYKEENIDIPFPTSVIYSKSEN